MNRKKLRYYREVLSKISGFDNIPLNWELYIKKKICSLYIF